MLFQANLLASTDKIKLKPEEKPNTKLNTTTTLLKYRSSNTKKQHK